MFCLCIYCHHNTVYHIQGIIKYLLTEQMHSKCPLQPQWLNKAVCQVKPIPTIQSCQMLRLKLARKQKYTTITSSLQNSKSSTYLTLSLLKKKSHNMLKQNFNNIFKVSHFNNDFCHYPKMLMNAKISGQRLKMGIVHKLLNIAL